jgi:hypothetical protein
MEEQILLQALGGTGPIPPVSVASARSSLISYNDSSLISYALQGFAMVHCDKRLRVLDGAI